MSSSIFTNTNVGLTPTGMIQKLQNSLGVHPINVGNLLSTATNGLIGFINDVAAWVFLFSELAVFVGGLVLAIGAVGHWASARRVGWRIIGFSVIGFFVGLIGPGILLGLYGVVHHG